MRAALISLVVLAPLGAALSACGDNGKSGSPASSAPAASAASAAASSLPASAQPAASGAPSSGPAAADGGAEQPSDQPLPAGPPNPASSNQPTPAVASFDHHDPGDLIAGSGSGYLDRTVWSPDMCFPLEEAGYANSQVYDPGGLNGPPGKPSQCDPSNYSLPWRDDFCEARAYSSPVCVSGAGHQGQDIRPATCEAAIHWAVAAEAGQITDIGSYTVTLTASASPHRVYRYLHMQMNKLAVQAGDMVNKGDHLGLASNNFGGTQTTLHLHFEIRAGVSGLTTDGKPVVVHTFLPPYLSLVAAYQRKLDGLACH